MLIISKEDMKSLHVLAFILLVVGGLNWGLVGLGGFVGANWNLVNMIFGSWPVLEWIVYILVGVSAVWLAIQHSSECKMCSAGSM